MFEGLSKKFNITLGYHKKSVNVSNTYSRKLTVTVTKSYIVKFCIGYEN